MQKIGKDKQSIYDEGGFPKGKKTKVIGADEMMPTLGKENVRYVRKGKMGKRKRSTNPIEANEPSKRPLRRTPVHLLISRYKGGKSAKKATKGYYEDEWGGGAKGKDGMVTPSSSTGQKSREEKKFPKATKMKKTKTKKRLFGGWESRGKKGLVSESGRGGPYSYAKGDVKGRKATWKSGHYDDSEYYDDGENGMITSDKPKWSEKLNRLTKRRRRRKEKDKDTTRVQNKINKEYFKLNPKKKYRKNQPSVPDQPDQTDPVSSDPGLPTPDSRGERRDKRKRRMKHGGKVKKGGMAVIIIANKKSKK